MVAIIKSGYSLQRILNYNENKVKEGVARCIGAENFPLDPDRMSFEIKLGCFQKLTDLNQRAKKTSVHISLNFDPSDNDLSEQRLMEIASDYMLRIGFGKQPFLVYRHFDAGHPHIHIVTTNVKADRKTIDMHLIGANKSEPARKMIEKKFGLVPAASNAKQLLYQPKAISVSQVAYGRTQTKKAIQNVLEHVINQYQYCSLAELNAVLGKYNIMAQPGEEGSRVHRNKGLLYRVLDAGGVPVGVPIKASSFYNKPTLKNLEEKFEVNQDKRSRFKSRVKNEVDLALKDKVIPLDLLQQELNRKGIDIVLRRSKEGLIYGITYVDHKTKSVFNGSALGKTYSAKAIQERCTEKQTQQKPVPKVKVSDSGKKDTDPKRKLVAKKTTYRIADNPIFYPASGTLLQQLVDGLTREEFVHDYIPYELRQNIKKKKKKKR